MYSAGKTHYLVILNTLSQEKQTKKKKTLASLLTTYNLLHTLNIATRIQKDSSTDTNNMFVDNSALNLPSASPIINCLSNQMLKFSQVKIHIKKMTFQTWESVYNDKYHNHVLTHFCVLS